MSLARVAKILKNSSTQVVFLTGAGTSVSAGIPDFRSPGGMYDTLKPELLTATESERKAMTNDPTTVVSWPLFKQNQFPYLELRRPFILGISDQKWKPTATHIFMRICHDKGILKHVFTQNIDGLDYQTGIPSEKVISVHGSMGQINCEGCGQEMPQLQFNAAVKANIKDLYGIDPDAPKKSTNILCDKCHKPLVKPNTVLYGRSLPSKFFEALKEDFPSGGGFINILFVVGTSLTVHPAASVPQHATASMKVLVNVDEVGQFDFSNGETSRDIFLQGKCDEMFVNLAAECGWLEEMASFDAIMSDSSRLLISEKMKEMENQIKMNNGTAGSSGGSVSGGSGSSGSSSGGSKK